MVIHINDFWDRNFVHLMVNFIIGWCPNSNFEGIIFSIGDS